MNDNVPQYSNIQGKVIKIVVNYDEGRIGAKKEKKKQTEKSNNEVTMTDIAKNLFDENGKYNNFQLEINEELGNENIEIVPISITRRKYQEEQEEQYGKIIEKFLRLRAPFLSRQEKIKPTKGKTRRLVMYTKPLRWFIFNKVKKSTIAGILNDSKIRHTPFLDFKSKLRFYI